MKQHIFAGADVEGGDQAVARGDAFFDHVALVLWLVARRGITGLRGRRDARSAQHHLVG